MNGSAPDLWRVVENASSLWERADCRPPDGEDGGAVADRLLERWCQVAAKGDTAAFEMRLAWAGLDRPQARRCFGAAGKNSHRRLPGWTSTLEAALATAQELSRQHPFGPPHRCLDRTEPLPYEEVCLPFVLVARRRLARRTADAYALLSDAAHAALERRLLAHLSALSARVLQVEFSIFRAVRTTSATRLAAQAGRDSGAEMYHSFVGELLAGGLRRVLLEYSVLARLMAQRTDCWVEAVEEFLLRLEADQSEIERAFGQTGTGRAGPLVAAVEAGLSDMHDRGRSVFALTFASGLRLVYKPRDLGIEEAYFDFLRTLGSLRAECGTPPILPLRSLKVLTRSTHGWVEYVRTGPCDSVEAGRRFYLRAGQLLCLAYVLGATDLHHENLLASGEEPVLIDLETLMHPVLRAQTSAPPEPTVQYQAYQRVSLSVLRNGMLPAWQIDLEGRIHDVSGLRSSGEEEPSVWGWKDGNADAPAPVCKTSKDGVPANVPTVDGVCLLAGDYVEEIVTGFSRMYLFLRHHREALRAPGGPLAWLAGLRLRFVVRPTGAYLRILDWTLDPALLRSGVDRSIEIDLLARGLLHEAPEALGATILRSELDALENLDVPLFATCSDHTNLIVRRPGAEEEVIEGCFERSGYDCVRDRLDQLSEGDLEQQTSIIRAALRAARAAGMHRPAPLPAEEHGRAGRESTAITPERLKEEALEIARELRRQAIVSADGSVTWLGLAYYVKARRQQLEPLGYGLYDGTGGIALFLSALETSTGEIAFRDLALGALRPLQVFLRDPPAAARLAEFLGIGGATGLGSIIYALTRVGITLGEDSLVKTATQAVTLITNAAIAADRTLDVISGSAGAILGLLSLRGWDNGNYLERAVACGLHLLRNRLPGEGGLRAWPTVEGQLMTGFSHGAAGIAYALLRLFQASGESCFRDAAEEAIAYEQSTFSPADGSWLDLRQPSSREKTAACSWCHGPTGIGIARLGGLPALGDERVLEEIETACRDARGRPLAELHNLCCGNLGRAELLLLASQRLGRPGLIRSAFDIAGGVLALSTPQTPVSRRWSSGPFDLGLFQGISGAGYELLRLAHPDRVPSVLLWE